MGNPCLTTGVFLCFPLTKVGKTGYNTTRYVKDWERKSKQWSLFREPRQVERGTEKAAEHGPGVGVSIFRHTRVRPLLRFEAEKPFCHCEAASAAVAIPHTIWGFPRSLRSLGMTEGRIFLRIKVVPRFIRPCSARAVFILEISIM